MEEVLKAVGVPDVRMIRLRSHKFGIEGLEALQAPRRFHASFP